MAKLSLLPENTVIMERNQMEADITSIALGIPTTLGEGAIKGIMKGTEIIGMEMIEGGAKEVIETVNAGVIEAVIMKGIVNVTGTVMTLTMIETGDIDTDHHLGHRAGQESVQSHLLGQSHALVIGDLRRGRVVLIWLLQQQQLLALHCQACQLVCLRQFLESFQGCSHLLGPSLEALQPCLCNP